MKARAEHTRAQKQKLSHKKNLSRISEVESFFSFLFEIKNRRLNTQPARNRAQPNISRMRACQKRTCAVTPTSMLANSGVTDELNLFLMILQSTTAQHDLYRKYETQLFWLKPLTQCSSFAHKHFICPWSGSSISNDSAGVCAKASL